MKITREAAVEIISYLFWGVMTTVVNIGVFQLSYAVLALPLVLSNILAWFFSVLFAYLTNRRFVFHSEAKGTKAMAIEAAGFFGGRIASGVLDTLLMWIFVDRMAFDAFWMKVLVNVIVVIVNYLISKLLVFRKKGTAEANK